MKYFLTLLTTLIFSASLQAGTKVYILSGQSNMQGGSYIPYSLPSNVTLYDKKDYLGNYISNHNAGPEVGVANVLGNKYPNDTILLIKHSKGGRSLYDFVYEAMNTEGSIIPSSLPYSENDVGDNNSPYEYQLRETGAVFTEIIDTIDYVFQQEGIPQDTEIEGVFWMQGEGDSFQFKRFDRGEELYSQYKYNFEKLIWQFEQTFNMSSSYQFIVGRIYNYTMDYRLSHIPDVPFKDLTLIENFISVRKAQTDVVESLPHLKIISTDKFTLRDVWHYDYTLYPVLGECMAKMIDETSKKKTCETNTSLSSYTNDTYTDSNDVVSNRDIIEGLYLQYHNRFPDYEGYLFWINEFHNDYGQGYSNLSSGLGGVSEDYSDSCKESGGYVVNGDCHFGYSCVSEQEAMDVMTQSGYLTCNTGKVSRHHDCSGLPNRYIASCPLINTKETNNPPMTTKEQIFMVYNQHLNRNPDEGGYNWWSTRVWYLESTAQSLIQQEENY